jgi:hypothetical protein
MWGAFFKAECKAALVTTYGLYGGPTIATAIATDRGAATSTSCWCSMATWPVRPSQHMTRWPLYIGSCRRERPWQRQHARLLRRVGASIPSCRRWRSGRCRTDLGAHKLSPHQAGVAALCHEKGGVVTSSRLAFLRLPRHRYHLQRCRRRWSGTSSGRQQSMPPTTRRIARDSRQRYGDVRKHCCFRCQRRVRQVWSAQDSGAIIDVDGKSNYGLSSSF